jgi:hypothetical protein
MLTALLLIAAAEPRGATISPSISTATITPMRSPTATPRQWDVIFGSAGVAAAVMLLLGVIAVYFSTRSPIGEYEEIRPINIEQTKW